MSKQTHDVIPDGDAWAEMPDAEPDDTKPDDGREIDDREPFPVKVFDPVTREAIDAFAAATGSDTAYVTLSCLSATPIAIGGSFRVAPKRGWTMPCVIFGVSIGSPRSGKSPPFRLALAPLVAIDRALNEENRKREAAHRADLDEHRRIVRRLKPDANGDRPPEPTRPPERHRLVDDFTPEKLAAHIVDNPDGCGVYVPELRELLGRAGRYHGKGDGGGSSFFNRLWDGEGVKVTRKGAEPIVAETSAVSICGTSHWPVWAKMIGGEATDSGLAARFLIADAPHRFVTITDDELSDDVIRGWAEHIGGLHRLHPWTEGEEFRPRTVFLDERARTAHKRFSEELAVECAGAGDYVEEAAGKLIDYAARFGLILQLADDLIAGRETRAVGLDAISRGIRFARWFLGSARRAEARLSDMRNGRRAASVMPADRLLRWIDEKHAGIAPQSEAIASLRRIIKNADEREDAVRVLEGRGDIVRRNLKRAGDGDQGGAAVYLCRADLDAAAIAARGLRLCHEVLSRHEDSKGGRDVA